MSWVDNKIKDQEKKKIIYEIQSKEWKLKIERQRTNYQHRIGSYKKKINELLIEANRELKQVEEELAVFFDEYNDAPWKNRILFYSAKKSKTERDSDMGSFFEIKIGLKNKVWLSYYPHGSVPWQPIFIDDVKMDHFNKGHLITIMGIISGNEKIISKHYDGGYKEAHYISLNFPELISPWKYFNEKLVMHDIPKMIVIIVVLFVILYFFYNFATS